MILICQYTIQIYTTITLGDINVSGFVQIYYATNATNENISNILAFKYINIQYPLPFTKLRLLPHVLSSPVLVPSQHWLWRNNDDHR